MTREFTGTPKLSAFFEQQTELLGIKTAAPVALSISATPAATIKAPEQP